MDDMYLIDPGPAGVRTSKRRQRDFYPTPTWATEQLIKHTPELSGDCLYDPSCGDGKMAKQISGRFDRLITNDFDPGCPADRHLDATGPEAWVLEKVPDWVVTNPPFSHSGQIATRALLHAKRGVAFLLRITWLEACAGRFWLRKIPPSRLLILPRISFTGAGTDSATCAWFIWIRDSRTDGPWSSGEQRILYADPCDQDGLPGIP